MVGTTRIRTRHSMRKSIGVPIQGAPMNIPIWNMSLLSRAQNDERKLREYAL